MDELASKLSFVCGRGRAGPRVRKPQSTSREVGDCTAGGGEQLKVRG